MSSDVGAVLADIVEAAARHPAAVALGRDGRDQGRREPGDRGRPARRGVDRRAPGQGLPGRTCGRGGRGGRPRARPRRSPTGFFLVDPLDGTKAFCAATPIFAHRQHRPHREWPAGRGRGLRPSQRRDLVHPRRRGAEAQGRRQRRNGHPGATARPGQGRDAVQPYPEARARDALRTKYGYTDREPMDSSIKFCIIAQGDADIYPGMGRPWSGTSRPGAQCCRRHGQRNHAGTVGR